MACANHRVTPTSHERAGACFNVLMLSNAPNNETRLLNEKQNKIERKEKDKETNKQKLTNSALSGQLVS